MPNIKDLTFLRLIIAEAFKAIPRRLFESIEEFTPEMVERIYKFSPELLTDPVYNQAGNITARIPKPSAWVAVMQDIGKEVKGFVWLEFDIIEPKTIIRAYAVDTEYQSEEDIEYIVEYIKGLAIADGLKGSIKYNNEYITRKPEAVESESAKDAGSAK